MMTFVPRRSTRLNASLENATMEPAPLQPTTSTKSIESDAFSVADSCHRSPQRAASVVFISSESGDSECESPRSGQNLLKQLNSKLNSYWVPGHSEGRVSRYGRHQKTKEREGFVPTDLARFVSKTPSSDQRRMGAKTATRLEHLTRSRSRSKSIRDIRSIKTPRKIKARHFPVENLEKNVDLTIEGNDVSEGNNIAEISPAKLPEAVEISATNNIELPIELPSNIELPKAPKSVGISTGNREVYLSDVDSGRGSSIDFQEFSSFKLGSLYWAKFNVKCWWPCLVSPEPDEDRKDLSNLQKIHVRFFADNGRRSWILPHNLIAYQGLDDFKSRGYKLDLKYKMLPKAIEEADFCHLIPLEKRIDHFQSLIDKQACERAEKLAEKAEKRRLLAKLRSPTPESPAFETDVSDEPQFWKASKKRALSITSDTSQKKQKLQVPEPPKKERTVEEVIIDDFLTETFDPSYLYTTQMKKEPVCRICFKPAENEGLKRCSSQCFGMYHLECNERLRNGELISVRNREHIGLKRDQIKRRRKPIKKIIPVEEIKLEHIDMTEVDTEDAFSCFYCDMNLTSCFVCHEIHESENLLACSHPNCGRSYHKLCLDGFPQATLVGEKLTCPLHSCHTCLSKDICNKFTISNSRLVQCVLCPTSFHYNSPTCVLAGTEFITTSQMICTKHPLDGSSKVNVNWCFVCSKGGQLICCERCPATMHASCLHLTDVPDKYICDQCQICQRPLYNEVVWAKMGGYRFWPAICLAPQTVPLNMLEKYHAPNDVCVRFFGSKDYAWLSTDRMFLYESGDSARNTYRSEHRLDTAYSRALADAQVAFELLMRFRSTTDFKYGQKPPKYVTLRTNTAVPPAKLNEPDLEEESSLCLCSPEADNPCGIDSNCLNRTLMQECDPTTCPSGEKCQNQQFTHRLYPKLHVKHTPNRGFGLFAGENIVTGTFVVEYVGEVIDTPEYRRRLDEMSKSNADNFYFMTLEKNLLIDAGKKGNLARFINHSCAPNCTTEKWTVGNTMRVGLFATRDIQENEELTFDYQFECIGSNKTPCHCGSANCSGFIGMKKAQSVEKETNKKPPKKKRKIQAKTHTEKK